MQLAQDWANANPDRSWWENPYFSTAAQQYNERQKVLGESELTPEIRSALLDIENRQHRESSELPRKK